MSKDLTITHTTNIFFLNKTHITSKFLISRKKKILNQTYINQDFNRLS